MKEKNFRAGIFVLITLALLVFMILKVSKGGLFFTNSYPIYIDIDSAVGLSHNTPVLVAGVNIGVVEEVQLTANNKARVKLAIKKDAVISSAAKGMVKTMGILGDAYIEIYQPGPMTTALKEGEVIQDVVNYGDFNSVTGQISAIADDVKAITKQMRKLMAGDDSTLDKTMKNIEKISDVLARTTTSNEKNIDVIIANLKALSQNLNTMVAHNMPGIDKTIYNLENITDSVNRGEGTVGKLLKDEETVNKINDALDGINDFLGGTNRTRIDVGMHTEYLAGTGDFKNYVSLALKPRPDKYFLFEIVSDPDPSFGTSINESTITSGGATSTVTTKTRSKVLDGFKFSAQFVKKFHDFSIRGGLIESSGGVGLDWDRGPVGLTVQAFDFKSDVGQKPHITGYGRAMLTNSFYLMAGVDDIINTQQDLAWFLGAGITFTDDDIKSLLGLMSSRMK